MEKNNKTLNVPHLRFPEFSGEWEKCKVSDILEFYSTNSLAWEQLEYGTEGLKNLHYGLIHNGLSTCVDTEDASLPVIKQNCTPKNYTECQNGDVAFADASEDTNDVAKCVEFTDCHADRVVCGLHTIHGRDKGDKTVVGFKGYSFSSQIFRNQIRRLAQGTKIYSISSKNFSECSIGIPSKVEQAKIATLLKLIDQRIQTQKKIIEKYESLIIGLCEKLTRQGTPNKTISECLECHSSTLQESTVLDAGSYPVYGAIGICGYTDTPEVSGDGILIIKDGASVGVTYFADGSYSSIGTLNRLTAKEDINLRYIYYCLKVLNFTPYKTGLAIPHIYFKDYGKHNIWCPPLEQQSRIVDALTTIDNKIQVEKSLLEQLNSQKRYMLKQMFI